MPGAAGVATPTPSRPPITTAKTQYVSIVRIRTFPRASRKTAVRDHGSRMS
jgi:hypothetical protein